MSVRSSRHLARRSWGRRLRAGLSLVGFALVFSGSTVAWMAPSHAQPAGAWSADHGTTTTTAPHSCDNTGNDNGNGCGGGKGNCGRDTGQGGTHNDNGNSNGHDCSTTTTEDGTTVPHCEDGSTTGHGGDCSTTTTEDTTTSSSCDSEECSTTTTRDTGSTLLPSGCLGPPVACDPQPTTTEAPTTLTTVSPAQVLPAVAAPTPQAIVAPAQLASTGTDTTALVCTAAALILLGVVSLALGNRRSEAPDGR